MAIERAFNRRLQISRVSRRPLPAVGESQQLPPLAAFAPDFQLGTWWRQPVKLFCQYGQRRAIAHSYGSRDLSPRGAASAAARAGRKCLPRISARVPNLMQSNGAGISRTFTIIAPAPAAQTDFDRPGLRDFGRIAGFIVIIQNRQRFPGEISLSARVTVELPLCGENAIAIER